MVLVTANRHGRLDEQSGHHQEKQESDGEDLDPTGGRCLDNSCVAHCHLRVGRA